MAWYVYMLRCGDGSLYTGYTDNVDRRLRTHQSGKGGKYTRSHLPVALAYQESLPDKSAALRREAAIKRLTRQQKLTLIDEKRKVSMVEMRRKDRQLSEEKAWEVLECCEYVVLSMISEDAAPYAVPLNVVRDGNCLYFHGAMAGRKAACFKKGSRVCAVGVSHAQAEPAALTMRYASAIAFGTVEMVSDPVEKGRALRLLCDRYQVPAEAAEKASAASLDKTAIWKLSVDEITGKANC